MTKLAQRPVRSPPWSSAWPARRRGPRPGQEGDQEERPGKGGGTIEVNESKDGKFRFTVRDADGKYLGGSATGYATKEDAVKAVDALKAALATAKIEYNKKDDKK